MRNILHLICVLMVFRGVTWAQQLPAPLYQWNFNQDGVTEATTNIIPTIGPEAMLEMVRADGVTRTNLFSINGGGISGNLACYTNDRALDLSSGAMSGLGPIVRTPSSANVLTNLGVLSNFTITAWIRAEAPLSGFPRILMLNEQNGDTHNNPTPMITFLQYNWAGVINHTLQLKVNGANQTGAGGLIAPDGLLAEASTNWIFLAVTYDATIDGLVASNVNFYVGNRTDTLGPPAARMAYSVRTINTGLFGCADNNPGPVIFDAAQGGINPWVYIGNRNSDRNRGFKGRYDDIRIYNTVLTQEQLEAVRQEACPWVPQPLQITQQPANTTVVADQGAAFTVVTTEAPNLSYQWYRSTDGGVTSNAIAGATSKFYRTPPLSTSDTGTKFAVRVTSPDPIAGSVFSSYATVTVLPTNALTRTPGMLSFEYFADAPGASVTAFLNSPTPNYAYAPDLTLYLAALDSRTVFPDDSRANYFVRISGWITPTVTTNYVFFIRASDTAQLWLSTDDTTNNLQLIASDTIGGPQPFYGPETLDPATPPNSTVAYSTPVALEAGKSYAVQVYYKAGLGQDFVQVAWRMNSDPYLNDLPANVQNLADRLQPIPAALLSTLALPNGTVSITQQPPASVSIPANSKVTLNVGVHSTGPGPLVVQWQRNGTNIPGATGSSYTTPYLTESGQYRAIASVPGASVTSAVATVTVTTDTAKPTVVSATSDDSAYAVTVQFSEPVDAATALNTNNYAIPGLAVVGAEFAVTTNLVDNPQYDAVKLTTSRQADNTVYTVTVSNVKDTANNTIASGNTATFRSYGFAPGFARVAYFENQTPNLSVYSDDGSVNFLATESLKMRNDDADTIVYPRQLAFSPQGGTVTRSASGGGGLAIMPPVYATRLKAIITPTNTADYVFYLTADDSAILWLSTDDNPANKCVIAYQATPVSGQYQGAWTTAATGDPNTCSATFDTNLVGTVITVPGARPWPYGNTIRLQAGQRYYLQADHREYAGWNSYCAVTWDNGTGTMPPNGSPILSGSMIGWRFPQPQITSFAKSGDNIQITWNNGLGQVNLGAVPYPGIAPGSIDSSFPSPVLISAPAVTGPWTIVTNTSPATIPATNAMRFFRIGQ